MGFQSGPRIAQNADILGLVCGDHRRIIEQPPSPWNDTNQRGDKTCEQLGKNAIDIDSGALRDDHGQAEDDFKPPLGSQVPIASPSRNPTFGIRRPVSDATAYDGHVPLQDSLSTYKVADVRNFFDCHGRTEPIRHDIPFKTGKETLLC